MTNSKNLHTRNKHNGSYNFEKLIESNNKLEPYVSKNKYNNLSINFFDSNAVKELNKAILIHHYNIKFWDIESKFLTPSIPGRAEYIHIVADLLKTKKTKTKFRKSKCLDIGVGANLVYPIIGVSEYDWDFVGTDINENALKNSANIIDKNKPLQSKIELRHQENSSYIFKNCIKDKELFELTVCNPPFHDSKESVIHANKRKNSNLKKKKTTTERYNFNGTDQELWCEGGELNFIKKMITESVDFRFNCLWFTTLVSQERNIPLLLDYIKRKFPEEVKILPMQIGNKKSRILAWTFIKPKNRVIWRSNL